MNSVTLQKSSVLLHYSCSQMLCCWGRTDVVGSVSCSLCFRELHYLWNISDLCPLPHLPPGAVLRMWQTVPLLPWESQPSSNDCHIIVIITVIVIIIPKQDQSQVRISLLVSQYQVTVHSRIVHWTFLSSTRVKALSTSFPLPCGLDRRFNDSTHSVQNREKSNTNGWLTELPELRLCWEFILS